VSGVTEVRDNSAIDVAKKRSKDLFSLLGRKEAIIFTIAIILLSTFLAYLFKGPSLSHKYLILSTIVPLVSFIMTNGDADYLDSRRSLWISVFISFPLVIDSSLSSIGMATLSMSYTIVFLASLITWSLGVTMRSKSLPFLLAALFLLIEPSKRIFFSIVTSFISVYLFKEILGAITEQSVGLRGFDAVRALAEIVLTGRGRMIEEALERRSKEGKVSFDIIRLGDLSIITIDVHPGPFRFGSYDLPFKLIERFDKMSETLFLRRSCSHERNLPSRSIVERLLDRISLDFERASECCIGKLFYERSEHFEVTAQRICDSILFTVSGHLLRSLEDIPREFEDIVSRALGMDVSIVDRHDSLLDDWYIRVLPGTELGEELIDLLIKAGRKAISSDCYSEVSVGFSKSNPRWRSLGRGGIRALSISLGGETVTYLSVDCNNIVPELRSFLDFNSVEGTKLIVSTTDTHETLTTRVAYNPLGSECEGKIDCLMEIADQLKEVVRDSIVEMRKVRVKYYRGSLKLPLIGEENMFSLVSLMGLGPMAKGLLVLSLVPQILIFLI
jgi:predicted neutral ceramidase superfamily lipid hydrolase